jgi:hypothetical protein
MGDEGIADIVKWAESQGWSINPDNSGYLRFYDPQGNYITYYPSTPKNSYRRRMDVLVKVKKAGLPWPVPSKKEQRAQRRKGDAK